MKRLIILIPALLLCVRSAYGQKKMSVEEIAFYHLDSLKKIRNDMQELSYFTSGMVESKGISIEDTICLGNNVDTAAILYPGNSNIVIVDDLNVSKFNIPKRSGKNGGKYPLTIFRHLKVGNKYFVCFHISRGKMGDSILLTLDLKGNLLRYCVSYYEY